MLLYICVKFHENISNGFELQSGHDFVTDSQGKNNMSPNPTGGGRDIMINAIEQSSR